MKDKLDRSLSQQRSELDIEEPNRQRIWKGIEAAMTKARYKRKLRLWKVAAALLAILALGQLSYLLISRPGENVEGQDKAPSALLAPKQGAFEMLEASYEKEVSSLKREVAARQSDPAEYAMFYNELRYIEKVEDEFKADIPLVNDKERIAKILVDTYEKKIQLLERMLQQIERQEERPEVFQNL